MSATPSVGFAPAEVSFSGEVQTAADVDLERVGLAWDFGDGTITTGAAEVTHRYTEAGVYQVRFTVAELSENGTRVDDDSDTVDITIHPPADLRVSVPFLSARSLRSQDPLRVTFDLFSDSGEVPIPFRVGVYLAQTDLINHASPPDAGTLQSLAAAHSVFLIASTSFERFDGEGHMTNVDLTDLFIDDEVPSDTYEVLVYADDTGAVGESDELNNVQFAAQSIDFINTSADGPDLVVTRVRARPSRTNALSALAVDIEITNQGNEPAREFQYDLYLSFTNTVFELGDTFLGTGTIANLPAGASASVDDFQVELTEPRTAIGNYFVLADVDSTDAVDEANEDNNLGWSQAIIVTDQPIPGTDLVPIDLSFEPLTSFLDGTVNVVANVLNQGSEGTTSQFFCRLLLSEDDDLDVTEDVVLDAINFPSLSAGQQSEQQRIARIPGFFEPGLFYLFLFCDPNQQIPEADEDNNVLMADERLEISTDPEIDLRFGSFDLSPTSLDNGDPVTVSMEVCNDGTNGVGPSVVRVTISQDNLVDLNDTTLLELTLDPIDANDCLLVEESVPAICDTFQSTYRVFAEVDVTDLLPETDETNNLAELDTPLVIEGIYCICQVDPLEGSNNSPATPTFISARTYTDLSMCDLAVDWYAIPLVRGDTVRVTITFDRLRGNLDMTLYAADRATVLDQSLSNGDREEVLAFVVPETGNYLLKVFGRTTRDLNVYDMTVEVTGPQAGTDLIASNIRLSRTTPVLGEEVELTFSIYNLGDVAAQTNTARVYLSEDLDIDPVDDPLLTQVVLSDVPAASYRQRTIGVVMPTSDEGGNRYLGVVADALNQVPSELDETNNVGLSDLFFLDAGCYDPLEPNNSLTDPYSLPLTGDITTATGLLVCTGNNDVYQVCGDQGEYLLMRVQFDSTLGDVDLYLFDAFGSQLARSEGSGNEEIVEVDYIAADQCYLVEVLVLGRNREVPYDLVVENGIAPEELRCSNAAEPNESFGGAVLLRDSLDSDLAICPVTDLDFFKIYLSRSMSIELTLEPVAGAEAVPADLRMSLWGPQQNFIWNTVSATETIAYTATSSGQHYLRVSSMVTGPRSQAYRLDAVGLDGVDLQPLDFAIAPQVCYPGDRIQYGFSLQNNRNLATGVDFHYGVFLSDDPFLSTNQDRLLKQVQQPALLGFASILIGDKVTIPTDLTPDMLYYLAVFVDSLNAVAEIEESNNIAVLPLQVESPCLDDGAEPNDVKIDAADIEDFLGIDLTLCPGDTDWFVLEAPLQGEHYNLDASFSAAGGDLDLYAYGNGGELWASGESLGDDEHIEFDVPAGASRVFIQVAPFMTTDLVYQLALTIE